MWIDQLSQRLNLEEGRKSKPYRDTVGKLTIGVGHNLDDLGISNAIIDALLLEDINIAVTNIKKLIPNFDQLSDNRKIVVTDMMFNMGYDTLSKFKTTLGYISSGAYTKAADAMLQSLWAKQVGNRAVELSEMMRNG